MSKNRGQAPTLREIRRCLKRYLARDIYRRLNTAAQNELTGA